MQIDVGLVMLRPDSFCVGQKEDVSQDSTLDPYEMNDVANVFYGKRFTKPSPQPQGVEVFDRYNVVGYRS